MTNQVLNKLCIGESSQIIYYIGKFLFNVIYLSIGCPVVIISPGFVSTDFGTSAQFIAIVESNFDPALESRWLRQRSSITETVDINHQKFLGSKNLPSPELLINNVTFEDGVNYQLQVRIVGGWCFGNTVSLEVRGSMNIVLSVSKCFICFVNVIIRRIYIYLYLNK